MIKENTRCENGFTLVELLVALVVTSIVLTAVATLAFAMGTANDVSDDTSRKQAEVRFATLRISELLRYCKLIYDTPNNDIVIWKADNNGDDVVDSNELVYIETGPGRDYIQLREADDSPVVLIPGCSNVQFWFDEPLLPPPQRKSVSISFDLTENGVARRYQTNTVLRGWAGHLLDGSGGIVSSDDD
ncbi:MAG: prepilin-type N-terminal cleavage/methylation domain-containing protein [Planctomycetota bacterium]|jgi:prepilin-type N-terminal cleavage/methylation domain-containing protein